MSEEIQLSILVPAVFERDSRTLCENITMFIQQEKLPFELLVFYDNRKRSIGQKRKALFEAARGRYIMHLDDDDDLAPEALLTIWNVLRTQGDVTGVDVISFDSQAQINDGTPFRVRTGMGHENEQCREVDGKWGDIKRKPWQWCVWKRSFVESATYSDGYIDEDAYWLFQLWARNPTEHHIDEVLHFYYYNSAKSLAQQGVPTVGTTPPAFPPINYVTEPGLLPAKFDVGGECYDIGAL